MPEQTLVFPQRPSSPLEELDTATRKLVPQLEARIIDSILLGTAETAVAHGCPATPRFFSVRPHSDARWWMSTASDSRCIYITASAAVTVDILVTL